MEAVVLDTPPESRKEKKEEDEDIEDKSSEDSDDDNDDDEERDTPAVIRIAAKASVFLIDKYLDLIWDYDLYVVVIGELSICLFIMSEF